MVSEIYDPEMSRTLEASCLKCERLHASCYSFIREAILSETVIVSNYARWGCQKYKGPGMKIIAKNNRMAVLEALKTGELLSVKRLTESLLLEKRIVLNNISRLKKKGFRIRKKVCKGEILYQLAK